MLWCTGMQFTSKRASIPTAVCIRRVVHKSGPCAPHPGCLLVLSFLPPQLFLPPSLLGSLKKPARGWLPISHEKPFTHTSAPSLINQGLATWQWECRQALFLPVQSGPQSPSFLTVTPTGASLGRRQTGTFRPISQTWEEGA